MTTNLESFKWWANNYEYWKDHPDKTFKWFFICQRRARESKKIRDQYFILTLSESNRVSQSQKWERDGRHEAITRKAAGD